MVAGVAPDTRGAGAAGRLLRRIGGRVEAAFLAERERWTLWIPVFLGIGIGIYFALPFEPAPWTGPAALVCSVIMAVTARRNPGLLLLGLVNIWSRTRGMRILSICIMRLMSTVLNFFPFLVSIVMKFTFPMMIRSTM